MITIHTLQYFDDVIILHLILPLIIGCFVACCKGAIMCQHNTHSNEIKDTHEHVQTNSIVDIEAPFIYMSVTACDIDDHGEHDETT